MNEELTEDRAYGRITEHHYTPIVPREITKLSDHPPERVILTDEMHHAWSLLRTEHDNRPCRYCHLCNTFEFLDPRFPIKESKCDRETVNPVRAPIKAGEEEEGAKNFEALVESGRATMGMKPVPRELL